MPTVDRGKITSMQHTSTVAQVLLRLVVRPQREDSSSLNFRLRSVYSALSFGFVRCVHNSRGSQTMQSFFPTSCSTPQTHVHVFQIQFNNSYNSSAIFVHSRMKLYISARCSELSSIRSAH